ncbi:MAG: putative manganese transporter [Lachnospiraceae bacterium]
MELLKDIILDTSLDCIKMLPFLFGAFLLIEALEHYSGDWAKKMLQKVKMAGPLVGAIAGCIPQCGFSVMAANLYAGGIISPGTLISVFISTSDEAILIIMSNPEKINQVGMLLMAKIVLAVAAGYFTDFFLRDKIETLKDNGGLCKHCGCHEEKAGIFLPAWRHTRKIFVYLFIFTAILNLCIEVLGIARLSALLLGNTIFQPIIASVIGFIPNCAASVILTQLYLNGAISFSSVIAGLSAGTGVGLVVLCKVNSDKKESVKIAGLLFIYAIAAGILMGYIGNFISF